MIKNQTEYQKSLIKRNISQTEASKSFEEFFKLDENLRRIITKQEHLRAKQNQLKGATQEAILLKTELQNLASQRANYEKEMDEFLLNQPNILLDDVHFGSDEKDNKIIFETPKISTSKNQKPHYELIDNLIMKDSAAHVSGSRFVIFKKELSLLKRALTEFMLTSNATEGYEEYVIPYLVNESSLYSTGQLPKFSEDAFKTVDGRWLISTGEISLVNMFGNQVFSPSDLPKLCMTFSPCFRSEAGAAGRDTRGLMRLHQFHKLELVTICKKEDAQAMHEKQLKAAQKILDALNLQYRVLLLCGADTGFTASKQYDIEVWMPGLNRYFEIASCSQCSTFQAVRANIRYKNNEGILEFAHTLNGSSLPIERLIAAIIENYAQDDRIIIPQALRPYMNCDYIML